MQGGCGTEATPLSPDGSVFRLFCTLTAPTAPENLFLMTWTLSKLFVFNSLALKDGEVNVKQVEERESLFTLYKHIYLSVLPPRILWL